MTSRSPGDPLALLDAVRGFLQAPRCVVVSTLAPDGAPRQVVAHYRLEAALILVNGRSDRRWLADLRRDDRVSLLFHDGDEPLHWVGIVGRAARFIEGRQGVEDAMAIAQRYGENPHDYEHLERVSAEIVPTRVVEYGRPREVDHTQ